MNLFADFMSAKDFIEKLIPNFWSFLIQLLSLIVLIVVIIVFAYKPVKKILKTRQDYIDIMSYFDCVGFMRISEEEAKEISMIPTGNFTEFLKLEKCNN